MTPQEIKASEIIGKFYQLAITYDTAKECAKIAVNEIIASIPTQPSTGELERVDAIMFWINVKQEIDKI
jgi:hypothetical protein